MNLLKETTQVLKKNKLTVKDVLWVGTSDGKQTCSWEQFSKIANIEYDNGFGGSEIGENLVVVGESWWLERGEYDGSEWWEFKSTPRLKSKTKMLTAVRRNVDVEYEEF